MAEGTGRSNVVAEGGYDVGDPGADALEPDGPLQRLETQGGQGVPLAAAAADVAQHGTRYTARTQIATVMAYHVMANNGFMPDVFTRDVLALKDRPIGSLFVDPGPITQAWLDQASMGKALHRDEPTQEPAAWVAPMALWFIDSVDELAASTVDLAGMLTHDAPSIVAAGMAAGAVAAASLLMTGRDLVLGVAETGDAVLARMSGDEGLVRREVAERLPTAMDGIKAVVGSTPLEVDALLARVGVPDEILPLLQGIVLAADATLDPIHRIEVGCELGPDVAVVVGGMVGGQAGLRRWPWRVANETWFAEIGRRLCAGSNELRDLPIPYAVEERMRRAGGVEFGPV